MTSMTHSRRDLLKGAVAVATTVGVGTIAVSRRAHAQAGAAQRGRIDAVLRQAVDAKEVPGVVAMAATDRGLLYEGAFGVRALDKGPAMTLDTVFRIASMTKAITSVAAMQLVEHWARPRFWKASTPPARRSFGPRSGQSRYAIC